jgi:hypothetical protein
LGHNYSTVSSTEIDANDQPVLWRMAIGLFVERGRGNFILQTSFIHGDFAIILVLRAASHTHWNGTQVMKASWRA